MAARPAQAATAAAAEEDMRQCIYETEWQVSQAAAAAATPGGPGRHGPHHELAWVQSGPAAAAQKARLLQASAVSPAVTAAQATLRQAGVLQQIMTAPGALPRAQPSCMQPST
jgi:hypothetical protein